MRINFPNISNLFSSNQSTRDCKIKKESYEQSSLSSMQRKQNCIESINRFFQLFPELVFFWIKKIFYIFSCSKLCQENIDREDLANELQELIKKWKKGKEEEKRESWKDFHHKYPYQGLKIIDYHVYLTKDKNRETQKTFFQNRLQNFDYQLLEKYHEHLSKKQF